MVDPRCVKGDGGLTLEVWWICGVLKVKAVVVKEVWLWMWWGDLRCVEGRGGGDDGLTVEGGGNCGIWGVGDGGGGGNSGGAGGL